jgi:murein DD-endopeptidase MepM/ murein hydrolase activator NlpD
MIVTRISIKLKKFLVSAALQTLRFISLILKPLTIITLGFAKGLKWLIKKSLLKPILFGYFWLLKFQKAVFGLRVTSGSKYIIWLKRYSFQIAISAIILLTASINISARGLDQEQFGSKTILANLVRDPETEASELVTESGTPLALNPVSSYLEDQGALQNPNMDAPFGTDDVDSYLSTTQGDTALVAPNINDPDAQPIVRTVALQYTVQPGDTISTIAQKFSISSNTVLWANNLTWSSTIKPGQKLQILPTSGLSHTVKSGDTVSSIAKKYQIEPNAIISFNKLANEKDIYVGENLIIPGGVQPAAVPVTPPSYARPRPATIIKNIAGVKATDDRGGAYLWPTNSRIVTQYYSWKHTGVDIGDHLGNPIFAAESGKVITAGWNSGGYGNYVIIDHGNGILTLYGHASALLVEAGDVVSRGQQIAKIGSTGHSTGPHLHFEVRVNGSRLNPLNYIK